jgi:hypothetical protein
VVRVAERFADGQASDEELRAAEGDFTWAEWEASSSDNPYLAALATEAVTQVARESDASYAARTQQAIPDWPEQAYQAAACASNQVAHTTPLDRRQEQWDMQVRFLRCIFGNPFRPGALGPAWLSWNGGTVPNLAKAIYDDRRYDLLPVLADALEEAGCGDADLLAHCRGPGQHVRGCWVLDLLLGKE